MLEIKNFFEKFLKIQKSDLDIRRNILSVIFEIAGIKLTNENLDIKDNYIYLKCKPIYRNEIFMKKNIIEERLKQNAIYQNIA